MEHLAALLNPIARGETIPNRVDLIAGYQGKTSMHADLSRFCRCSF
jgi:hypothetical protein